MTIDPDALDGALLMDEPPRPVIDPPQQTTPTKQTALPSTQPRMMPLAVASVATALVLMVAVAIAFRNAQRPPARAHVAAPPVRVASVSVTRLPAETSRAEEPKAEAAGAAFEVRFPGVFSFNDVSPSVDDATVAALAALVRARCGQARISVSGHTCNRGTPEANLAIGRERAVSVAGLLAAAGLDGARLSIRSAGSREPIATNLTSDGRNANRRVIISCRRDGAEPKEP